METQINSPIILISAGKAYWQSKVDPDTLRISEKELIIYYSPKTNQEYLAVYDLRYITKLQAYFGIITTLVVCGILLFASLMLTKTTTDLVISPIENMIKKVQAIATNPLKAAQEEEN